MASDGWSAEGQRGLGGGDAGGWQAARLVLQALVCLPVPLLGPLGGPVLLEPLCQVCGMCG